MASKIFRKCSLCLSTSKQVKQFVPTLTRAYTTGTATDGETADVVIAGGGMVGAAMACVLGHEELLKGKRILLLEAGPRKKFSLSDQYDMRTCTLSPATIKLFKSIGAWDEVLKMRCQPVRRMQVWESCSNALIAFNHEDMTDELAHVAENSVILEAITQRLEAVSDRIEVLYNTRTESIDIHNLKNASQDKSWVTLKLNDGRKLNTKLLIGSDGMNSSVRKAANFHTVNFNYNQKGVVAVLHISETENNVAWQRFLPTGPIAMLPVSDSVSNLIWTTTADHAKHLQSLDACSFVDTVNDAFWHERDISSSAVQVGEFFHSVLNSLQLETMPTARQLPPTVTGIQENSRAAFPLGLGHSSNYVRSRVALIGDAAHRLHPLAGQGVNLGFGDVACLRDVLTKAVGDGSDIGSLSYLKEYETARQRKVLPVMATIDGLQRLYSTDFTPIVLLRSVGLQATNALSFIKDRIIKQAAS